MASRTHQRLVAAGYPMVDEAAATGRVAGVYAAILERFPMVPSLFKSLAVCPGYLELAWEQTRRILDADEFTSASQALADAAADAVPPPPDEQVRRLVARFVRPLSRMLLATAGLRLALDGSLDAPSATPTSPPDTGSLDPELHVPPTQDLDPALVGAVRADLATPIVNSIWRVAAAEGLLEQAWSHFGPLTRQAEFSETSDSISERARETAASIRRPAAASRDALADRHLEDAIPGIAAVLDAYLTTLPRVLTLVASSREPPHQP